MKVKYMERKMMVMSRRMVVTMEKIEGRKGKKEVEETEGHI